MNSATANISTHTTVLKQYVSFYLKNQFCGIPVESVQEIVRELPLTHVPLAPDYVKGLINLRGQIAVAVDLGKVIGGIDSTDSESCMNIICRIDDNLIALAVEKVGDVVTADSNSYENVPDTISKESRQFIDQVCQVQNKVMSVIETSKIMNFLNQK